MCFANLQGRLQKYITYEIDKEKMYSSINNKMGGNNPEELRRPVQIFKSNLYVETNYSANSIRKNIVRLLNLFDFTSDSVKKYIGKDFSVMHEKN